MLTDMPAANINNIVCFFNSAPKNSKALVMLSDMLSGAYDWFYCIVPASRPTWAHMDPGPDPIWAQDEGPGPIWDPGLMSLEFHRYICG